MFTQSGEPEDTPEHTVTLEGDKVFLPKLLRELNGEGQTVIMVTHNPEYRGRVQRVLDMRDGEFVS